eukprot:GILK01006297.1.p1 GENE.GILK01006297.1~~GILK01006297.1.p1  ORF type:complete len:470 (+),score=61.24 GILK01006297.1:31-1410(+)
MTTRKGKKGTDDNDEICRVNSVISNGYRQIIPYTYEFRTYTKRRWLGRPIIEVFCSEFQAYSRDYYERAIEDGRITVNRKTVAVDYLLKDNELIVHKTTRTEPPVFAHPIEVVADTKDLIVVSKPSSIPVHPCGAYRANSVLAILEKDFGHRGLHPIHRLDRVTSGIVLFGKNPSVASMIDTQMRQDLISKEYVARVIGDFPSEIQRFSLVDNEIRCQRESVGEKRKSCDETQDDLSAKRSRVEEATDVSINSHIVENIETTAQQAVSSLSAPSFSSSPAVDVDLPIACVDPKRGVYRVSSEGKSSHTVFRKVSYDASSNTSVVYCKPTTGRTHQIRVHLQSIGFPIANDAAYGGVLLISRPHTYLESSTAVTTVEDSAATAITPVPAAAAAAEEMEPDAHSMEIWLHAFKYAGPKWNFEIPWPKWAAADFTCDRRFEAQDTTAQSSPTSLSPEKPSVQ